MTPFRIYLSCFFVALHADIARLCPALPQTEIMQIPRIDRQLMAQTPSQDVHSRER
jgi:hypothetical protein